MSAAAGGPEIIPVAELDMRIERGPCAFAQENRPAIDANFAERLRRQPAIWNGRVLALASHAIEAGRLVGRYVETDYASLLWLLAAEPPHPEARNAFAMGALRGADGGFVLARMAPWTANAGRIYFAAGTPDPEDVTAYGRVDLEASMLRELTEETGLPADGLTPEPSWTVLRDARRVAMLRQLVADVSAEALAERVRAHIAAQERPEIDAALVVHGPGDLAAGNPAEGVPPFLRAYLDHVWQNGGRGA